MKKRLCIIWLSVLFVLIVPTGVRGQVFSDDALKFSQIMLKLQSFYPSLRMNTMLFKKPLSKHAFY